MMRFILFLFMTAACFTADAQISIRNYIGQSQSEIMASLDDLGIYYELQYDTAADYYDGEQMIMAWASELDAYVGNSVWIYLMDNSCYQIQYNFFGDNFVLESLRTVMMRRPDFYPCPDFPDCWAQERDGDTTTYYWNLFETYEGDETWKALIIEDQENYEANRYEYEWDKY